MFRQGSAQRRGAPLPALLVGTAVLVVALVTLRAGDGRERSSKGSTVPVAASAGAGATGGDGSTAGRAGSPRALPAGLDDRGWIAEISVQRWLAGSLSGRVLVLPPDEIALTATATSVVSVRYGAGGATSTVRVRDLAGGRLRASVDRPGTVSSAVITGTTVYVAGDAGSGGSDAGVQAISLDDGSVSDLIPSGPAPADAAGPITRSQLRLDRSGRTLASPLCAGEQCSVDLVDLGSGARTTPVRGAHGFLVAFTNREIYLVDDTSTSLDALDAATGERHWRLNDVQIGGLLPASDGRRVLLSFLPSVRRGPPTFTLASADATNGDLHALLQRSGETDLPTFYPNLSGDRFAVMASGRSLGELLGGIRRRAALTLVDAQSGATQADAVNIDAP